MLAPWTSCPSPDTSKAGPAVPTLNVSLKKWELATASAGSGGGRAIVPVGTPGKNPFHGQLTGGVAPAEAVLLAVWVGSWLPDGPDVEAGSPPPRPDAAFCTQLQGSEAEVLALPPGEVVLAELGVDEGANETLVPDAAEGALIWPAVGGVFP